MTNTFSPIGEAVENRVTDIQRHPYDYKNGDISRHNSKRGDEMKETQEIIGNLVFLSDLSYEENKVEWVWEGFLAKGCLTLLSAWPKTGKTTLLAHFLEAQDHKAESFLKHDLKSTKTLVMSEEIANIWVTRRETFGFSGESVLLSKNPLAHRLSNKEWESYLSDLVAECKKHSVELVVFDTLSSFWPITDENSAPNVVEALKPLRLLTQNNLAVLLVHHERKSGGEHGAESRGSGAIAAFVDILVNLKRPPKGGSPNTRVISTISRFDDNPERLVIELNDGEYVIKEGLPQQFSDNVTKVLEGIPVSPQSVSQVELLAHINNSGLEISNSTLWRWLKKAENKGLVISQELTETRGKPRQWSRVGLLAEEAV